MSSAVFPVLVGQGWDIGRRAIWDTTTTQNTSGKEVRMANFTYPLHQFDVSFNALRQGTVHGAAYTEFAQLFGFINQRQGSFDSFLYTAPDDYTITAQALGNGDGSEVDFQLIRSLGGFIEPIFAPNTVSAVYVDGVLKTPVTDYAVSAWGSAEPGVITFTSPPANGKAVTATFTYYWPCRFLDDSVSFNKFTSNMYEGKKVSFITVKN